MQSEHVFGKKCTLAVDCVDSNILGQSFNANDIIADIWKTIHPQFSEFRLKGK